MATGSHRASVTPGRDSLSWLKIYMFDVVTLLLTMLLALKFWWTYLGLHDSLLMSVALACSSAEVMRRLVVAKRLWQRPATFFSDRRSDLLAGIVLGTGPWPMLPVLDPSLSWQHFAVPMWLRLFALSGVLVFSARRLIVSLECSAHHDRRTLLRQLTAVPDIHVASMIVAPVGVSR
jgi:hypothetical protein